MLEFKCDKCNFKINSYDEIYQHYRNLHNMQGDDIRRSQLMVYQNGSRPTCKCGCGAITSWNHRQKKISDYKSGHYVKTTNGFFSPIGAKKSAETLRRKFSNGELQPWNKGVSFEDAYGKEKADIMKKRISADIERSKKISNSLKGKKLSDEHVKKLRPHLKKIRKKLLSNRKMTRPELEMKNILEKELGLSIKYQESVGGYYYDFYLLNTTILIEVDGDFWHCKPGSKYEAPIMQAQIKNIQNDKIKNKIAKNNGYTILRFWESDIKNSKKLVIEKIKENL